MDTDSGFAEYLKSKRIEAGLTQRQLALSIGKTGMYISNIEKGKNLSPPKQIDLTALADALKLMGTERSSFFEAAAADRLTLPKEMFEYIYQRHSLKELVRFGIEKNIPNKWWEELLNSLSRGK